VSITSESWWGREIVPAALNALFRRCCTFFKSDPLGGGTKGNAAHDTGRHRSFEWVRNSAFCSDRSYGTRDKRDRDGNPRHIRAFDVKLTKTQIREVSHRLDKAVRAGDAPMVAEWFGTFDNQQVVGWYEGHPSSADDSHLAHVHVGVWTIYADDAAALDALFAIMTGDDMALTDAEIQKIAKAVWDLDQIPAPRPPVADDDFATNPTWQADNTLRALVEQGRNDTAALQAKMDQILAALSGGVPLPPAGGNTSATFTGSVEFKPAVAEPPPAG